MCKRFMQFVLVLLSGLVLSGVFFLSCLVFPGDSQNPEINVWRKVSTDDTTIGEIVTLDMSKGYAHCHNDYILIVVNTVDMEEEVVVMFPNGGYWSSPGIDPFFQELEKEFDSLEEYLRGRSGTEWKK